MTVRSDLLHVLQEVGFQTGEGPLAPFGQPLPLVTAWALDPESATLAVVVEDPEHVADHDPWRELLFALSGLRHELRHGNAAAIGTPVVLALLEREEDALRLRGLVEELTQQYVLFSRVELNSLVLSEPDFDLYRALAPLLPRCRQAIKNRTVLDRELLATLASELQEEVSALGEKLEASLRERGDEVIREYGARLARLVEEGAPPAREPLDTWDRVRLANFRSFEAEELDTEELTLVDGLNGTGKSSVIEALEILWSGTTQRKPLDDDGQDYDRHLARNGENEWSVMGWRDDPDHSEQVVSQTAPPTEAVRLSRNVFTQDAGTDIASETRARRYAELLRMTGLAIPELLLESEKLNREAKTELDKVLGRLRIQPLRAINMRAADHVRKSLADGATWMLPPFDAVRDAEARLGQDAKELGLAFRGPDLRPDSSENNLERLKELGSTLADSLRTSDDFIQLARECHEDLVSQANECEQRARAIEALLSQAVVYAEVQPPETDTEAPVADRVVSQVPSDVAAAWLHAGSSLRQSLDELAELRDYLLDPSWRERLDEFMNQAQALIDLVPFDELEPRVRPAVASPRRQPKALDPALMRKAGLSEASISELPRELRLSLTTAGRVLRAHAAELSELAQRILDSPLVRLEGTEDDLHSSLARFEVARQLKAPLAQAQETLLNRLLRGPLEPVLSELISALTRFEWYFHPFEMTVEGGRVRFGGLATRSTDLDVRMLLNTGERSIVRVAWFLALHLLQPPEHRTILVLDDPFTNLDENNQAAFVSTLRAFARLTRPRLLLLSCHDRTVSDAIEREFAQVNGWPSGCTRLRCSRSPAGTSTIEAVPFEAVETDLSGEIDRLGLSGLDSLKVQELA